MAASFYSYVAPLAGPACCPSSAVADEARTAPLPLFAAPGLFSVALLPAIRTGMQCRAKQLTTSGLLRLSFYSRRLMHEMCEGRARFRLRAHGKLVFYSDAASSAVRGNHGLPARARLRAEALDRDGCVALEPALGRIAPRDRRRIYTPSEDAGDCYHFAPASNASCARPQSRAFRARHPGHGPQARRSGISAVETNRASHRSDLYVVTLGAQAWFLLRPLASMRPIYPLKGYSLTLPIASANAARSSAHRSQAQIVYARLGEELPGGRHGRHHELPRRSDPARTTCWCGRSGTRFPAAPISARENLCGLRPASERHAGLGRTRYATCCSTSATRRARVHARVRLRQDRRRLLPLGTRRRSR